MEGEHERLGAEAHKQQAEGQQRQGFAGVFRQERRNLCQVQSVQLAVQDGGAGQNRDGAQSAHGQVLKRTLNGTLVVVPEGGQGHGAEGHDLNHNVHVEQVAAEDQTQHGAGEHQEQGEIGCQAVIFLHVGESIDAGGKHGHGNHQAEEQAQRIYFDADADCPAGHRFPVAQPVGDNFAVDHNRLNQSQHEDHCAAGDQEGNAVAENLAFTANQRH